MRGDSTEAMRVPATPGTATANATGVFPTEPPGYRGAASRALGRVRAVACAARGRSPGAPVAGAVQALRAAHDAKWRVAVVSKNSAECMKAFLASNGIADAVDEVIGRPRLRPDLMKPAPYPLLAAAKALGVDPAETVLIGDATDVVAAKAATAWSIGFANKPSKRFGPGRRRG
ncbi:HAD family hydrolase [Streptomyces sp. NPDC058049]|uniref:HAD family hydrolase n=1 Tax=Streptomyces sp. NPDC058049 TaxID=3346314 RepID=UPI0036E344F3